MPSSGQWPGGPPQVAPLPPSEQSVKKEMNSGSVFWVLAGPESTARASSPLTHGVEPGHIPATSAVSVAPLDGVCARAPWFPLAR
jgi:hypothetical protein